MTNVEIKMTDKFVFFLKGPFSQWYKRPFVKNEITYNCAEQFMMSEKFYHGISNKERS